jgi:DNA-binding response OmpR family regulator
MSERAIILVVNTERILVDLLVRSLEGDDLATYGASSVFEASRLFENHQPDLVIIDPTIDGGFDFLKKVQTGLKPARILALFDSADVRNKLEVAGVDCMADKNAGLDALVTEIRSCLKSGLSVQVGDDSVPILIADDESGMRGVLAEYLNSRGYATWVADDGRAAVDHVRHNPSLRLVLLDVSMPRMGGLEALRQIMSAPTHPDVIMMTGVADREVARQALDTGAFDYVLKPFDLGSIESSITACLSSTDYHSQPWWKRLVRPGA